MTERTAGQRSRRAWWPDLPGITWLLSAAQALNLTAAVIAVTIAALVGSRLAASPALGTVPYGVQFAVVMLCTYPAAMLMRRLGRRTVFSAAALMLVGAGAVGYWAVETGSFAGLIMSHAMLGAYISCANFYRFAAVDQIPAERRPSAISLVVAGGVAAAVLGPTIASLTRSVPGHAEFSLCYGSFMLLGVLSLGLMALWKPAPQAAAAQAASAPRTASRGNARIWTAVFCSAGAYLVMNLLMVQASLVMKDICSFTATSNAIRLHVLAMFAPSFFAGALISRLGLRRVLLGGFALLAGSAAFGLMALEYDHIVSALILLGLGWNLAYVGGGALLAQSIDDAARHRWQGINDTAIAACATLGAFLPAPLLSALGWNLSNLAAVPLCAIGMFMCAKALPSIRSETAHAGRH